VGVFEVAIGPGHAAGTCRVEVVRSDAGEATAQAVLDAARLTADRSRYELTVLASAVGTRQRVSPAEQVMRDAGRELFGALLGTEPVAGRYQASMALAAQRGEGLRIVLRIDAPELAGLPWEAMYDAGAGGYVCRQHELVRHVPVAAVPPALEVTPPLRVLGVVSAPRGLADLDAGREQEQLERALAGHGLAEVSWAEPTWAGLHERLLDGPWHVLHFIGHGDFDAGQDEGVIALTGADGRADWVEASRLADLLRRARPMPRLVVLSSCSGGTASPGDLFSGTAAALARSGIGAVAAMQYAISDPAAVAFARGFYAALARGRGVDDAVSDGRIAILGTGSRTLEWMTPVLYLRGKDARLFGISRPVPSVPPAPGRPGPESARPPEAAPAEAAPAEAAPAEAAPPRTAPVPEPAWVPPLRVPPRLRLRAAPGAGAPSRKARVITGHNDAVWGVAFSPDGTLLATTSSDRTARLWNASTGAAVRTLAGHGQAVYRVAFSPDGSLIATASGDKTARLWETHTGALVRTLSGHGDPVRGIAFSPDGSLIATASDDKTARLWNTRDGSLARTLTGHTGLLYGVAFSPDGALVATGCFDETARLWHTGTGALAGVLSTPGSWVLAVAFSPDGSLLATVGNENSARLWHTGDGTVAHVLAGHTGTVREVAFSPDGALVATGSYDDTARLWHTGTGAAAGTLTGHKKDINGVAFSPDGSLLATASDDKTAWLWE
jgi:WD40 repeat protein